MAPGVHSSRVGELVLSDCAAVGPFCAPIHLCRSKTPAVSTAYQTLLISAPPCSRWGWLCPGAGGTFREDSSLLPGRTRARLQVFIGRLAKAGRKGDECRIGTPVLERPCLRAAVAAPRLTRSPCRSAVDFLALNKGPHSSDRGFLPSKHTTAFYVTTHCCGRERVRQTG